jgi:hypothetical protein
MFTGYKQAANAVSIPRTDALLGAVMALLSIAFLIVYLG